MKPFQYVKSAVRSLESRETRLSKEFRDKSGSDIVDIVSDKTSIEE